MGTTLGVTGAPICAKCQKGSHFNGECPSTWGAAGFPLPGFDASGNRIDSEWNVPSNEPIRKTIRAWVAFLKEPKTFRNPPPIAAGVAGAPDLAAFEGRVATAPAKP